MKSMSLYVKIVQDFVNVVLLDAFVAKLFPTIVVGTLWRNRRAIPQRLNMKLLQYASKCAVLMEDSHTLSP